MIGYQNGGWCRMIGNKRSFGSITTNGNPTQVTSPDRFLGMSRGRESVQCMIIRCQVYGSRSRESVGKKVSQENER